MKNNLKLKDLKIKSFATTLGVENSKTVEGATGLAGCLAGPIGPPRLLYQHIEINWLSRHNAHLGGKVPYGCIFDNRVYVVLHPDTREEIIKKPL